MEETQATHLLEGYSLSAISEPLPIFLQKAFDAMPAFLELVETNAQAPTYVLVPQLLLLALACWRLYKFTFLPAYRPTAPKEYPYFIPCKHIIQICV